ncbi:hypothetical protein PR048_022758 [Dryococelus australis]|uniref:Uncharacterized protein n=1 Tax=Dryococelus australis TaxID=614101 RepID=A0ABQ9GS65_9NEOP|nr:hypothetical protein PR048_022758 [Dryococelus australis]
MRRWTHAHLNPLPPSGGLLLTPPPGPQPRIGCSRSIHSRCVTDTQQMTDLSSYVVFGEIASFPFWTEELVDLPCQIVQFMAATITREKLKEFNVSPNNNANFACPCVSVEELRYAAGYVAYRYRTLYPDLSVSPEEIKKNDWIKSVTKGGASRTSIS